MADQDKGIPVTGRDGKRGVKRVVDGKRRFYGEDGSELDAADFADHTEDAGNTVIGGKDRSGISRANSSEGSHKVKVAPKNAPVLREEPTLSLAERARRAKEEREKKATPQPTPKKGQLSALFGDRRRA